MNIPAILISALGIAVLVLASYVYGLRRGYEQGKRKAMSMIKMNDDFSEVLRALSSGGFMMGSLTIPMPDMDSENESNEPKKPVLEFVKSDDKDPDKKE